MNITVESLNRDISYEYYNYEIKKALQTYLQNFLIHFGMSKKYSGIRDNKSVLSRSKLLLEQNSFLRYNSPESNEIFNGPARLSEAVLRKQYERSVKKFVGLVPERREILLGKSKMSPAMNANCKAG